MHDTAYKIAHCFLSTYWQPSFDRIVDIGSYDVNGSLRSLCPLGASYVGLDYTEGAGVDICVAPGEKLPLEDGFADIVLSSSVFEHDAFFWETFLELARVVRPGGFIYVNVPSNGAFHRFPADCWRFYPDAGEALARWAQKQGQELQFVESCIAERDNDIWNDFVAVFHKPGSQPARIPGFLNDRIPCCNIRRQGLPGILKERSASEDMLIIRRQADEIARLRERIAELEAL